MITELHSTIGRVSLDLIDRRSDLETQLSLASDLLRDTVRVLDGRTDMEVLISRSDLQSKLARVDELAGDEFGRPIVYSPGGVSGPARHCDLTFDRELVFQPGTLSLARLASESQEKTELESPEITETKEDTPEEVALLSDVAGPTEDEVRSVKLASLQRNNVL
ncbi:unnamed protein product [Protopolystoma xenopodis]|uniref:Uncharacterized protein n=1 Tax=Protopolystoma xenopodis TaxID=117903 RepID=A0A3S5AKI2_9PLAT|nr:unnamed protein product [Protopolystoma xenopodis]